MNAPEVPVNEDGGIKSGPSVGEGLDRSKLNDMPDFPDPGKPRTSAQG